MISKQHFFKRSALLAVAGIFIAGCGAANPLTDVFQGRDLGARKALMGSNLKNWKAINKAVKAGDYKAAGKAAGKIYKNAGNIRKVFKKKDMDGNTRARPKIWKNMGDFKQKAEFLAVSAAVFAQVHSKSGDKARINKAMKNIIQNCNACHKVYRTK